MMAEPLQDKHGIAFANYRALLPKRTRDWPRPNIITSPYARRKYRKPWGWCQMCERYIKIAHTHHIIHGSSGRSDEDTNLLVLCRECHHEIHVGRYTLANALFAKWLFDSYTLDWVRLAVLFGKALPDPEDYR